jgi:hypothetical protein
MGGGEREIYATDVETTLIINYILELDEQFHLL